MHAVRKNNMNNCGMRNLISFMSVENFLVLYKSCRSVFKEYQITFYLESSEFNEIIKKNFQDDNNIFNF